MLPLLLIFSPILKLQHHWTISFSKFNQLLNRIIGEVCSSNNQKTPIRNSVFRCEILTKLPRIKERVRQGWIYRCCCLLARDSISSPGLLDHCWEQSTTRSLNRSGKHHHLKFIAIENHLEQNETSMLGDSMLRGLARRPKRNYTGQS